MLSLCKLVVVIGVIAIFFFCNDSLVKADDWYNDPNFNNTDPGTSYNNDPVQSDPGINNNVNYNSDPSSPVASELTEAINSVLSGVSGLNQDPGTIADPGNPAGPLSNQNPGVDNGVIFSFEAPDPAGGGLTVSPPAPTLYADSYCVGTKPVVNLSWTNTPVNSSATWHLLKSGVAGSFIITQPNVLWASDTSVLPNTVYYYRVFSYNNGLTTRTPLSNLIGVYTPSCAFNGYVYNDVILNRVYDISEYDAEPGFAGETVQLIAPAYTTPGACTTTNDENGNPTGQSCDPDIQHPAAVAYQALTDADGYYEIPNVALGSYTVHHNRDILWPGWDRSTPNNIIVSTFLNRSVSFGLYQASGSSPSPSTVVATPGPSASTPSDPAPVVNLYLNGVPGGGLPVLLNQNDPQPAMTWQASNVDPVCTASTASGNSNPLPNNGIATVWTGSKASSGGPISIPTSQSVVVIFSLICTKNAIPYTASIQLNINQYPPAYFQTTGGDVHSNESITITPR